MIKFIYVILMNLFRAPYMIPKMRREADHPVADLVKVRIQEKLDEVLKPAEAPVG